MIEPPPLFARRDGILDSEKYRAQQDHHRLVPIIETCGASLKPAPSAQLLFSL
jgi:hypothetical protein